MQEVQEANGVREVKDPKTEVNKEEEEDGAEEKVGGISPIRAADDIIMDKVVTLEMEEKETIVSIAEEPEVRISKEIMMTMVK